MKKILLSMSAILLTAILSAQVIYTENFDSYSVGSKVASSATGWTTWSNLPGSSEDGTITNLHSSSGTNCAMISKDNDLVWLLGDSTSGKYEVSLKVFVPTDSAGYFNLLHKFAGGSSEWSNEVTILSHDSTIHLFVGGNDTASTGFVFNAWQTITYVIDLDNDFASFKINGNELFSWDYSIDGSGNSGLIQIGGMDFYGYDLYQTGACKLYIDDVKFEKINNAGIPSNCVENQLVVFPTYASDFLNIQSTKSIKSAKILDLSGSIVKSVNAPLMEFSMDISDLAAGIYYVQVNFGNSIAVKKFVKQ